MKPPEASSWYEALRSWAVACLLVSGAGAFFWYAAARLPSRAHVRGTPARATETSPATVRVAEVPVAAPLVVPAVPAAPPAPPPAERAPDEPTLMTDLRALVNTAPAQALALARHGDALFPNSPDAPERAWTAVKSLDLLKRFHEAQAEARIMRQRYPNTSWTEDVERHVLLYPLDQPSREEQQASAVHAQ